MKTAAFSTEEGGVTCSQLASKSVKFGPYRTEKTGREAPEEESLSINDLNKEPVRISVACMGLPSSGFYTYTTQ